MDAWIAGVIGMWFVLWVFLPPYEIAGPMDMEVVRGVRETIGVSEGDIRERCTENVVLPYL